MTLLGNRTTFGIELTPVAPSWERRYLPERSAWAGLALWVEGVNLCEHTLPGSERVHPVVYVPLAPVADWLVRTWPILSCEERARLFPTTDDVFDDLRDWLDARPPAGVTEDEWVDRREEWWGRHCLQAGADGAFLPNVGWVRQDDQVVVAWRPARFAGSPAPAFLAQPGTAAIAWPEFEDAVRELVSSVAESLRSDGLGELYPWSSAEDPLAVRSADWVDRVAAFACRTRRDLEEAAGGVAPALIASWLGLASEGADPAGSPVTQVLSDLAPSLDWSIMTPILFELRMRTAVSTRSMDDLSRLRDEAADASRGAESMERAGQGGARAVRRLLALDGEPVADLGALLAKIGVSVAQPGIVTSDERMVVGMRAGGGAAAIVLETIRTKSAWGRRFELARGLGHLLLDPLRDGAAGAASSRFARARRRRRSGAFAAEFLLPGSALAEASGGVVDGAATPAEFVRLLQRHGVGARTAAHQLWNHRWLSSADLRDGLIDSFAAEC